MGYLTLHWHAIAWALGVYAALATLLVRVISMPASPAWKRFAHQLLLDWPAALPALDMKGMFGLPINVPFLTLSSSKDAKPADDVVRLLLPIAIGFTLAIAASGCATLAAPPSDTTAQKMASDVAILQQVSAHVRDKCGPQFAPLGPLIASALAIAASPADALADIMAVAAAYPAIVSDVKALTCVVMTVRDDLKGLMPPTKPMAKPAPTPTPAFPAPLGSPAHALLMGGLVLERLQAELEGPASVRELVATLDGDPVPLVCDYTTNHGSSVCRELVLDDATPSALP